MLGAKTLIGGSPDGLDIFKKEPKKERPYIIIMLYEVNISTSSFIFTIILSLTATEQ